MPAPLVVVVDNRLRLPADCPIEFVKRMKSTTTHANPEHGRARAMGRWTGSIPTTIKTWRQDSSGFSLPRGVTRLVRSHAHSLGIQVRWVDRRVSVPVDWQPFLVVCRPYQEAGVAACVSTEQGLVRAPTGCIAGDTMIGVQRAGKSFQLRLADLVARQNGAVVSGEIWSPNVQTYVRSRDNEGLVRLTRLVDAYASGEKQTHEVRLTSGQVIRATADHRFLTSDGWLPLSALRQGMRVWVEREKSVGSWDRRGVHVAIFCDLVPVLSIRKAMVEPTYDLVLEAPNNFFANGVVVHNSGKTTTALAALPQLQERALVVVRDRNLLEQWQERAVKELGLRKRDIGVVQGSKRRVGERLTLALQQTLYSRSFPLKEFAAQFGALLVDEVHEAAARTVGETVDAFPARVRLGFSADHRRKDRKEFLSEDLFGDVIYEVTKHELEDSGHVVPVIVRLVPTAYEAPWYSDAPAEERDFTRVISELSTDRERDLLLRRVVLELVASKCSPVLVFTHRREHAMLLAESELPADGLPSGLMLGGVESAVQFQESKALLLSGVLQVAVGTYKACGQAIDLPNVRAGVCATPIGANKQFFGQVRGRVCRPFPGKDVGYLYYLWDEQVFPDSARNLLSWNDGRVEIFDRACGEWTPFRS